MDGGGDRRPPVGPGGHHSGLKRSGNAGARYASRHCADTEVRGHRLRQARRQGAGLCLGPRYGLSLRRRRSSAAPEHLRPAGPAHADLAVDPHLRRHCCSRPIPRLRPNGGAGPLVCPLAAYHQVPAGIGLAVGASGLDPGPLCRRRPRHRRAFRGTADRRAMQAAEPGRAAPGSAGDAPPHGRRPRQQEHPVRPETRPRRADRRRIHRPVPGPGLRPPLPPPDGQPGQHRPAGNCRRTGADRCRPRPAGCGTLTANTAACSTDCG